MYALSIFNLSFAMKSSGQGNEQAYNSSSSDGLEANPVMEQLAIIPTFLGWSQQKMNQGESHTDAFYRYTEEVSDIFFNMDIDVKKTISNEQEYADKVEIILNTAAFKNKFVTQADFSNIGATNHFNNLEELRDYMNEKLKERFLFSAQEQ